MSVEYTFAGRDKSNENLMLTVKGFILHDCIAVVSRVVAT